MRHGCLTLQVHLWRRSWEVAPPNGESLVMTAERVLPYYSQHIMPLIQQGKHVLISAHGNSLRALIKHIENMTPQQIVAYELKTGEPHIDVFSTEMKIVDKQIVAGKTHDACH